MPSFEVLLPAGAIAFYLFDSALLLYADEMALVRSRSGWSLLESLGLQAAGRRLHVPNPLAPGALLFRVPWHDGPAAPDGEPLDVESLRRQAAPLRSIATAQAVVLFLVLPPVSALLGAGSALLAVFGLFYALSLLALAVLFARRHALGVTTRQCTLWALEALACAPFAVNLVRKVSLARSGDLRWLALAQRSFTPDEKQRLEQRLSGRIDELLAVEAPESAAALRLSALRKTLQERLHVPVSP